MWSLAVFALLLMTAKAYSYQRLSYQVPIASGYQYNQNLHYSKGPSNTYSPGHAYVEQSQYQFLHGDQLSNQYRNHLYGAQQVNTNNPYSTVKLPGHAYYEKSHYQFLHGAQLNGNQININSQYGTPTMVQTQFNGLQPAIHPHGISNIANHDLVDKSQYQLQHGGQLANNHYNLPIVETRAPQVNSNQYATEMAPRNVYVEKKQYQYPQLGSQNNQYNANVQSHGIVNQYGITDAPSHLYLEKSQYQFLHGDQLAYNQIEHNAVDASSDSAVNNIEQRGQEHDHHTDVSYSIDVTANNGAKLESSVIQNQQSDSIQSVPVGDGNSILKPYQQPEVGKSNEQSVGFSSAQIVQPVVSKHVYFHVPPADIEELHTKPALHQPVKKSYKIIFIKVPSQESRNSAVIQQQLQSQLAASAETKTLIYVLVKKPDEAVHVQAPPSEASKPEVFYVKYKKNTQLGEIVTKISEQ